MIYKESLFRRELRRPYVDSFAGKTRLFVISVFLALVTVVLNLLTQIITLSALTTYLPKLFFPESFPFIYSYNIIAYSFFSILCIFKLGSMSLSEIGENKWYLLSKMGYNPTSINIFKMLSFSLIVIIVYAIGFALVLAIISFFKFDIDSRYFLSALTSGALSLLLLSQLTIVASLYSDTKKDARLFLISALILNGIFKLVLGYYKLLSDKVLSQRVLNLFLPKYTFYGLFSIVAIIILIIFAYIGAKNKSRYYSLKSTSGGFTVVRYYDAEKIRSYSFESERVISISAKISKFFMIIILFTAILFNSILIISSVAILSRISFFGYIPYVFNNSRMEPLIDKNDLVILKAIDSNYKLSIGDTVFIKEKFEGTEFTAMRVTAIKGDNLTIDFLKYPFSNIQNSFRRTISRDKIYGVLFYGSRVLGILILFANSLAGRILTIVLPLSFLFFNKRIFSKFSRSKIGF